MPQQLDWTLGDAPELDEPPAQPAPPSHPTPPKPRRTAPWRTANWRVAWLTLALVVVAVAGLGAYTLWNKQAVSRDLRQRIAAEEAAGRAGDAQALSAIADPADPAWQKTLLALAAAHQAAPVPYAGLQPAPGAADVIALTSLTPDEVRADVTRAYRAPDGTTLSFTLPQFYRFSQKQWHHIAPPATAATSGFWRGHYVSIIGTPSDTDYLANDLGPYLDNVVQRACDVWTCPRGPFIGVGMADDLSFSGGPGTAPAPSGAPLLFSFIREANPEPGQARPNLLVGTVSVQSPRLVGAPADAASAAWLRRAIALQTLNALANRVAGTDPAGKNTNAFLLALVVRMGARLGLEPASALDWQPPNAVTGGAANALSANVNLMWNLGQIDEHNRPVLGYRDADGNLVGPDNPQAWDSVLSGALAITDWMLRDQPPETDGNLLRALAGTHDQAAWLAQGLGVSSEAAWARLQMGVSQVNRPVGQPQLALNCVDGAGLLSPGNAPINYFLPWQPDSFAPGEGLSYSPDGQWVIGGGPTGIIAVNVDTGSIVRLALPAQGEPLTFRGWLTNSIIAYLLQNDGSTLDSSVHFLDLTNPQSSLPSLPGIQDYSLSPDKTRAAVFAAPDPAVPLGLALQVIPARGGRPTMMGNGGHVDLRTSLVAWSPDSQLLSYGLRDPDTGRFSLWVMDPATGANRQILGSQEIGLTGDLDGLIAWSPNGRQIAFGLRQTDGQSSDTPSAFGLANVDGTGLTLLRQQNGFYTEVGWSADGKYLAATNYSSGGQSTQSGTISVIDAASKLEVNQLVNSWAFAWSPAGHQLVSLHSPVELFAEPTSAAPQILSYDSCSTVAWQPQP